MINDKESWYGPFRHFLIASACTFHVETSRRQAKFDHLTLIKGPLGVTSVSKIGLTMYTWLLGMTSNHWFIVQSHSSSLVTLKMLESRAPLLAAEAWHLPLVNIYMCILNIYVYMGRNPFFGYRTPTDDQKLNGLLLYQIILIISIFINFYGHVQNLLPLMVTYHPMIYLLWRWRLFPFNH